MQTHLFKADYLSLYTSPSVTLHFGPTHQIYHLPEVLLQRLENIPSRDRWTNEIHLVDVDASIGHVLIHFLHTGVYQTLNDEDSEDAENTHKTLVRNEFQTAVLALEAAKKYSVPGLQELAQIELERRGKEMCLRDAMRAIREEFIAGRPDEHAWLRDFVSKKVRGTFEQDPHMLSAPDFFENIESPTLTQLLAQVIVGLYSEEVDRLRKGKTVTDKMSTPEHSEPSGSCSLDPPRLPSKHIASTSTAWPASAEKFEAFDDSVAAWSSYNLGQNPGNRPEASALAALSSCNKEETMELEKGMKEDAVAKERENTEARVREEVLAEIQQLGAERGTIAQLPKQDVAVTSSVATKDEADKFVVESMWDSWGSAPVISEKKKKRKKVHTARSPHPLPSPHPPPMSAFPPSSPHNTQLQAEREEEERLQREEEERLEEERLKREEQERIAAEEAERAAEEERARIRAGKVKAARIAAGEEEAAEVRLREEEEAERKRLEEEAAEAEPERRKKEEKEEAAAAKPMILSATSGLSWEEKPALDTDDWAAFNAGASGKKKKEGKKGKVGYVGFLVTHSSRLTYNRQSSLHPCPLLIH